MSTATEPNLGSVQEAADLIGVSVETIRNYVKSGRLTEYRVGPKLLRVDLDEVARLITVREPS